MILVHGKKQKCDQLIIQDSNATNRNVIVFQRCSRKIAVDSLKNGLLQGQQRKKYDLY